MGVSKFPKLGLSQLWGPIILCAKVIILCAKVLIEMRSETKLYPSSRVFQQYVAHYLHARQSGGFPTFSGHESNYQFDSRFFFWP
jgi:hypothetical protein